MPTLKLTKSAIDAVPHPEKGQVVYSDRDLPGFYMIAGNRSKTFAVQKDIRGRSVRLSLGKYGHLTPDKARKLAQEKLYLMSQGIDPREQQRQEQAQNITLSTILDEYMEARRELKPRTRADYPRAG